MELKTYKNFPLRIDLVTFEKLLDRKIKIEDKNGIYFPSFNKYLNMMLEIGIKKIDEDLVK